LLRVLRASPSSLSCAKTHRPTDPERTLQVGPQTMRNLQFLSAIPLSLQTVLLLNACNVFMT
jgi:hypothetical protein